MSLVYIHDKDSVSFTFEIAFLPLKPGHWKCSKLMSAMDTFDPQPTSVAPFTKHFARYKGSIIGS